MRVLTAAIAVAIGLLVLAGYFVPALAGIQSMLLGWAMILAGAAALLGVFNLISVHGEKFLRREKGTLYSALLIVSLFATFIFALFLRPDHAAIQLLVNGIILPSEAALMGILTVTLLYAAIRLLRQRVDVMSVVFLATVLLILLGSATLLPFGEVPLFGNILRPWVNNVLSVGGARGILIGVALGTLTTGLRVLFAIDRPYGGK
ncbi:MAG TPA: hypothetical protein VGJ22_11110 [Anaerolineales bacterium]|jgi:hypothetical protein